MAAKQKPDVVTERRLKPIYDRLDNGNNKSAYHEAEKFLKKHPKNQCVRVLKALALLRLGKEDECQSIIDQVRGESGPFEESTLQAMSICYRETQQPEKISEVYEAASRADPQNEDLLTHLFMSYVRLGDFKKQQQTALHLYKVVPKNPYYFWAVMSCVMQAQHEKDEQAKRISLMLAERMVLKFINENKIEAEQEVQLYLMILDLQGKTDEILKVLSGQLANFLTHVPQRKAKLLLKMKSFDQATKAYEELIRNDRDNWVYYQEYLTAGLQCQTATKCYKFLNETITLTFDDKVRSPQLARLELLKRANEQKLEIEHCAHICDDMRQYFKQFGTKGCVVGELKLYLHLLSDADVEELLEHIETDIGMVENEYPVTVDQMQKHIHFEELKRICGRHHQPRTSDEQRRELVKYFTESYKKGNALCPKDTRLPTDFCPADSYILLAVHILHQLWNDTREAELLCEAMILLEEGLMSSPANFHIKILLIKTYLEAGLAEAADYAYSLLDCKHIQLDSLGYLHVPLLAPLGFLTQAANCLDNAAKFFTSSYKDSADNLAFAFRYGSFLKIEEFLEFQERLKNSIHFASVTVDKMLLELSNCESPNQVALTLSTMNVKYAEDPIRWDKLRDNRDVDVVVGWEPLQEKDDDIRMKEETRECMVCLLAARSIILRIIAAANDASDSSATMSLLAAELRKLQNETIPLVLKKFEFVCVDDKINRINSVLVPLDAVDRLREIYSSKQLGLIAQFADSLANSSYPDAECLEALKESDCLKLLLVPQRDLEASLKNILFRASTCGETLAFLSAICTLAASHIKPNILKKKNRRKSTKETEVSEMILENKTWSILSQILSTKLKHLESTLRSLEEMEVYANLNVSREAAWKVKERANRSLKSSCSCLRKRVENTQKLINNLKS
ncbi:N-alpha-acetyltransferase 25, NatB auxiliary subunit [Copidosoma floridanum]|uniref:N-alpha-acetyltransferase 25, NatB auxiliary subunit n=1 Tax=Copidosoma floridanum TaxID=29053 RepID=UPI0006C9AD75|nr:N-alpha-acetyltransferase 25, NatB auxiliary subunit [Copidosoma floridanum]XP_014210950.1 N-alpha-acetyltransferase 25, NatB auxiliary subunit [Copidosoma floridanum]